MSLLVLCEHDRGVLAGASLEALTFGRDLLNTVHVPLKESLSDDYALGVVSVGIIIDDEWVNDLLKDEGSDIHVIFYIDGRPVAANAPEDLSWAFLKAARGGGDESFVLEKERYIGLKGAFE